jgi:hypothetical protein
MTPVSAKAECILHRPYQLDSLAHVAGVDITLDDAIALGLKGTCCMCKSPISKHSPRGMPGCPVIKALDSNTQQSFKGIYRIFFKGRSKKLLGVTATFVRVDIFPYLVLRILCLMDKSDAPALQRFLGDGHLVDTGALAGCQNQIVSLRRTHNVVQSFLLWKTSPVDHVEYLPNIHNKALKLCRPLR